MRQINPYRFAAPVSGFYVSTSGSGDGSSSSTPMSPSALIAASIPAGSLIFFNKGETFDNFSLNIASNGISIGSYGSGAIPKFRGSVDIGSQTWTSEGSNVWSTPYSGTVKWIFVNGVAAQLSESPWYPITFQSDSTHLLATSLISQWGGTIVGATVIVKEYYFAYSHANTVTAYDNGTGEITITPGVKTGLTGFSFKLFNQRQFMNTAGEWYYDSLAQKIYYQTSGSSPAGTDIRVCGTDSAININTGISGTTIDGVNFTQYYKAAATGVNTSYTTIKNCNVNNIRNNGLFFYGINTGSIITDNTFYKCGQNGVYLGGLDHMYYARNTHQTMGRELTIPFPQKIGSSFSPYEQHVACGVAMTYDSTTSPKCGMNCTFELNTCFDLGYVGISPMGSNHIVQKNHIYNYLNDFIDGGGIYQINFPQSPYFTVGTNCQYLYNIIHDAVGSSANTPGAFPNLTYGIYLDANLTNFTIDHNFMWNCAGGGFYVQYGNRNHIITNNTVMGGTSGIIFKNNTSLAFGGAIANGHVLTDNTFILNRNTSQVCITIQDDNGSPSFTPFTTCDRNRYVNPYGTVMGSVEADSSFYTLSQWQTKFSKDASSTALVNFITFTSATDADFEVLIDYNFSASSVPLSIGAGYSGYQDPSGNIITSTTQSIPAYSAYPYLSRSGDKNVRFVAATAGVTSAVVNAVLSPTYPGSLVSGDLLIVHATSAGGTLVVTPPAGWSTLVDNHTVSNGYLFYKISNGTETGTAAFTWTGGSSVNKIARMYQFRYTATSSFTEDTKNNVNAGTTTNAPTLTSTGLRSLAVSFLNTYNNTSLTAYSQATNGTWVEAVSEYIVTNVGAQLQYAPLRPALTISGGTMTVGANGSVSFNMILKNIV